MATGDLNQRDVHWIVKALMECTELTRETDILCGSLGLIPPQVNEIRARLWKDPGAGTHSFLVAVISEWISTKDVCPTITDLIQILKGEGYRKAADEVSLGFGLRDRSPSTRSLPRPLPETKNELGRIWFEVPKRITVFTGRDVEMDQVHQSITMRNMDFNNNKEFAVLCGLGGTGKTSLSVQYAWHMYKEEFYNSVIWINGESVRKLIDSFNRLISHLGIPRGRNDKHLSQELLKKLYKNFSGKKTLFIFDNVEEYNLIEQFLPKTTSPDAAEPPYVLITSRKQNWLDKVDVILLKGFSEVESVQFLKKYLGLTTIEEETYAKEISKLLEYLPLAVRQAGAFISMQSGSRKYDIKMSRHMSSYIKQFRESSKDKLGFAFWQRTGDPYKKTTLDTYNVTLERIKSQSKVAVRIMELSAYLSPDNIPIHLFTFLKHKNWWKSLGREGNGTVQQSDIDKAIQLLLDYSMIVWNSEGTFKIHRLVQQSIRIQVENKPKKNDTYYRLTELIELIQKSFLEVRDYDTVEKQCLVHCITIKEFIQDNRLEKYYPSFLRSLEDKQMDSMKKNILKFVQYLKHENYVKAFQLLSAIVKKSDDENTFGLQPQLEQITPSYVERISNTMCLVIKDICKTKPRGYNFPPQLSLEFRQFFKLVITLYHDKIICEDTFIALRNVPHIAAREVAVRTEDLRARYKLFRQTLDLYYVFCTLYESLGLYSSIAEFPHDIFTCLVELNQNSDFISFLDKFKLNLEKLRTHEQREPCMEEMNLANSILKHADHPNCLGIRLELLREALEIYKTIHEINKSDRNVFSVSSPDIIGILKCFLGLNQVENILEFSRDFQRYIWTFPDKTALKFLTNFLCLLLTCSTTSEKILPVDRKKMTTEVLQISEKGYELARENEGEKWHVSLKLKAINITCRLRLKINLSDCLERVYRVYLVIKQFSHIPKYLDILQALATELKDAGYVDAANQYLDYVEDRQ